MSLASTSRRALSHSLLIVSTCRFTAWRQCRALTSFEDKFCSGAVAAYGAWSGTISWHETRCVADVGGGRRGRRGEPARYRHGANKFVGGGNAVSSQIDSIDFVK